MKIIIILFLALMLVVPVAEARWRYQDATGELCYYINATTGGTGSNSDPWYDVAHLNFTKNSTFWNSTLRSYHVASGMNISQFNFAANSSHAFVFVPLVQSLSSFQLDQYCTYSGSANMSDIRNVSPYNLAFDNSLSLLTSENFSSFSSSQNPDGTFNFTAPGAAGYKDASAPSSTKNMNVWVKMKRIASNTTAGSNSSIGAFSITSSLNSTTAGYGLGINDANISHGFFSADSNMFAVDNNWHIMRINAVLATGSANDNGFSYSDQMVLQGTTAINHPSDYGSLSMTYLMYVRNASAQFDWALAYDVGPTGWNVHNNTYDFVNPNISILSPVWESTIGNLDATVMQVQYLQSFDNCTVTIQGTPILFYPSLASGQITTDTINSSQITVGENELKVSCFNGATESHRYWYFNKEGSTASELFDAAFGFDLATQGCSSTVLTQLDRCTEAYNLTQVWPFAAIVCPNINTSLNYSCISAANGLSNRTKNNFTLFWRPDTWSYDSSEQLQHIGATFSLPGTPKLSPRIELYSPTQFMYVPAQSKPRDCELFFQSSSDGCSWWEGFVLNNGSVIVSDVNNNWYQTGGTGIENFNKNFSQSVINVQLLTIINESPSFFPQGIFTRQSCRLVNGSWLIDAVNTQAQTYTITVLGNVSFSFSVVAASISQSINISNVSSITFANQNGTICSYGTSNTIFLPFSIPEIGIEGHTILIWIGLLFSVILSAVTPFALFIPFILNDTYQILDVYKMAFIGVLAIVAGFANNAFSFERGIKHLIIVVCLVVGYLVALSDYQDILGINLYGYSGLVTSITGLMEINSLQDFAFNLANFVISLFIFIILLPANFMALLMSLLQVVSPIIYSQAVKFQTYIVIAFMAYFYLKAFEVISNRFRTV